MSDKRLSEAKEQSPTADPAAHIELNQPAENNAGISHLFLDFDALPATMTDPTALPASPNMNEQGSHQATIALNVSDVIDLGTESIDGIDALVIHGEQGDIVRLANEGNYLWSRAVDGPAPEGYEIYQAVPMIGLSAEHGAMSGNQPVYVLVQHDVMVVFDTA